MSWNNKIVRSLVLAGCVACWPTLAAPLLPDHQEFDAALQVPFQATAGVKYWLRIEASQAGYPDWGIAAAASGGNGTYFRFSTGLAMFQNVPGDTAYTLLATPGPSYAITVSALPVAGGTVSGGGDYPSGAHAEVSATPAPGYGK